MPLNYNFAFKNSNLKRWVRPKAKNILSSKRSNKEKIQYLYQIYKSNTELFYPSGFIITLIFAVQLISIYPKIIIRRLESKHIEYQLISQKIANSQSNLKSMKRYSDSIKDFYYQSFSPYLFAFYLQKSLPSGVQLNEYFVGKNDFDLQASAYQIKSLNEMVTLLINSPVINPENLSISNISQEDLNGKIKFIIDIKGKMLKLTQAKRERLYEDSSAYGLLKKLSRFKAFSESLR